MTKQGLYCIISTTSGRPHSRQLTFKIFCILKVAGGTLCFLLPIANPAEENCLSKMLEVGNIKQNLKPPDSGVLRAAPGYLGVFSANLCFEKCTVRLDIERNPASVLPER